TRQIQTNLHAARMKTARPIQRRCALEIVPFHAEPGPAEAGPERLPARAERSPRFGLAEFGCATRTILCRDTRFHAANHALFPQPVQVLSMIQFVTQLGSRGIFAVYKPVGKLWISCAFPAK